MSVWSSVVKVFLFIAVGIATIIVGAFMLRGTMNMWGKPKKDDKKESQDDTSTS